MIDECIHDYIFSGSLPQNAGTYVEREADDELYEALQQGKFCYVLNSRQSGKSSLRVRTMSRLSQAGVECASIDLSSVSIQSATQENWYADLIVKLIDSFVLEVDFKDWWNKKQLNSPLMRFTDFIEKHLLVEITEDIVIFIDEIDSVLSLNFPTDDFFAFIRACYNQRVDNPEYKRLTFCLLGVASPSNLIQDKQRTPFNIGKAISLKGFKLEEVEPLEKGLRGKFNDSQGVIQEVLNWTGGQPFLTQKLCQFMVEESEKEKPGTVEQVVKSRIIESWESQDEPEHLRTIRARILRNEERAAYLLELYQQIRCSEVEAERMLGKPENLSPNLSPTRREALIPHSLVGKGARGLGSQDFKVKQTSPQITADNTIEQSELLLSGLVARRSGKLRIYNLIYKQVFNQNWVENELNNLRPYSESFRFWVASGSKDESRLLRGKALVDAEEWAKDKNLSYQDKQFLAASQAKEKEEEIAAKEKEAQLERERKDREAAEKINQVLSEANIKAKQLIRNGSIVLGLALLGTVISVTMATDKVLEAENKLQKTQKKLEETYTYVAYPQQLKELASEFSPESKQAIEISKLADIKIKNLQLEQAFLHASRSLAYQHLKNWNDAEESIKQSMKFLKGWEHEQDKTKIRQSNHEYLQTKIFALSVQDDLLNQQKNTQQVIASERKGFNILQESKSNPQLHDILIEFLASANREYLKDYYLYELNNLLIDKKWQEADEKTLQLMLFIADREEERFLDIPAIEKFSCTELKEIDKLWVNNSGGNFGFSVQKEIWVETGNRLGVKPEDWNEEDSKNYLRFARTVGWYNNRNVERESGWVDYSDYIDMVKSDDPEWRGGLPTHAMGWSRLGDNDEMKHRDSILLSRCDL